MAGRRWSGWRVPVCCIISVPLNVKSRGRAWLAVQGGGGGDGNSVLSET